MEHRRVHSRSAALFGATFAAFAVASALAGCGMPGAPLPPSLNLPAPVSDLSAVRTGGQVALTWTMPAKTTDKVLLKGNINVRVCRNESTATHCSIATTLQLAPKADASFTDTLPSPLAAGPPRVLSYFVELVNRKGRSAGLSNNAAILAGEAPPAIENLTAQMRKDGVLLRWASAPPESSPVAVRLVRRLVRRLISPPEKNSNQGPLAQPAEPLEQTLLVEAAPPTDHAPSASPDASIDNNIRFGQTYEYRAQRVARVTVGGSTLELPGPLSPPIRIDAINKYPPSAPKGLAAVATAGETAPILPSTSVGCPAPSPISPATSSIVVIPSTPLGSASLPRRPSSGPAITTPTCSPATPTRTPSPPSIRMALRALVLPRLPTPCPVHS